MKKIVLSSLGLPFLFAGCSAGPVQETVAQVTQHVDPVSCGPDASSHGDPCTITTTQIDSTTTQVRIDQPVIDRDHYDYSSIVFLPGDQITITAGGCAQTGGFGRTWKRYVNPSGSDSDRFYFGTATIPGAIVGNGPIEGVRVSDLIGSTISIPMGVPTTALTLGYPDDDYPDNGYYAHDDGNDDQCAWSNDGGPAFVILTIKHGVAGPLPTVFLRSWDIVPTGFDPNFFFRDPRWGWQLKPGGDTQVPPYIAGFTPDTSQSTSFDQAPGRTWDIGGLCDFGDGGHRNWFDVQYSGTVRWDSWDTPLFGDDDYNMYLTTQKVGNFVAGGTAHNTDNVKLEFDSDETIDHFDDVPFWRDLHHAADDGNVTPAFLDGHEAVVIGLMGMDEGHPNSVGSEIHPVHALAIRIESVFDPNDDAWAIFVRNSGDEGECSDQQHYINRTTIHLQLPRPTAVAAGIVPSMVSGDFVAHRATNAPRLFASDPGGPILSFDIPAVSDEDADDAGFYAGELHLSWIPGAAPASPDVVIVDDGSDGADSGEDDADEPEAFLADTFAAMTPEQQAAYLSLVKSILPPPRVLATTKVKVVTTTTPPTSEASMPTVGTRPARRHVQHVNAVATAFCATLNGAWPDEPTACSHMPPATVATSGAALTSLSQCFFNPTQVTLTAHSASGSPITLTEYSFDGTHFTRYTAPFFAPEGAVISYRSTDGAGNVEDVRTFTVPKADTAVALPALPLFAQGNLAIDDGVRVLTASGTFAPIANRGSGQTQVGVAADVGNLFSVGSVFLRDRSRVDGNVTTSGTITYQNNVVVTGTTSSGASIKLPDFTGCTASFPALTQNVNLEPSQTRTLAPGAYASVNVKSSASLFLSSGVYYFDSLDVEPQARVVLDQSHGPVFIMVKSQLLPKGSFVDSSNKLTNAFVAFFGTQAVVLESAYRGTVVAPLASVTVRGQAPWLIGAVFAKNIEVSSYITVTQQRFDFWNAN